MARKATKKDTPKITLLGSNSGRNAGDAAILAAIMSALSRDLGEDTQFEVPTTNPRFVEEQYGNLFNVTPINIMPWTLSIRLLGFPTLRSIWRTDATLITNGIIFDVKLFNPLFNFLITLVFLVPWAKMLGRKVICFNVGIGPLESYWGRTFARWVGNLSDLIMVRDEDSLKLFREIGVEKEIHLTADSVFLNWGASPARVTQIIRNEGLERDVEEDNLLGVNVTRYVDMWLKQNEKVGDKKSFLPILANCLARLRVENKITPLIYITQVMDVKFGEELAKLTEARIKEIGGGDWKPGLVSNVKYNNHELLGIAANCKMLVGMRVHSLIIAAESGTPVVGLVYAPKVRSFLHQLNTPERSFELAKITEDELYNGLLDAWNNASEIEKVQQRVVAELESRAAKASLLVKQRFFPLAGEEVPGETRVRVAQ